MRHYIHCHEGIDLNKGGTVGYLSSLLDGMQRLESFQSNIGVKHSFLFPDIGADGRLPNEIFEKLKDGSPFEKAYLDSPQLKLDDRRFWFHSAIPHSEASKVDLSQITSIHIHGAYNFLPVYNFLRLCGIEDDVVKIITTHNPFKPELEDVFHLNKSKTEAQIKRDIEKEKAYRRFLYLRDDYAFRMSDAILFPSEYSVEGYLESWPEFESIFNQKKIYYSITGTEKKEVFTSRAVMRKIYGINEEAKVFLYLGRFIPMRGFDNYVKVAEKMLSKYPDVYFLAVGDKKAKPMVDNERWIEVPYTSAPGDFLNMSDACVMANRGSYFDLGMIEALAQGIHLIASYVGGYKYLENKTSGVTFTKPDNFTSLYEACCQFYHKDSKEVNSSIDENIKLYEDNLTPETFAVTYKDTIDRVYEDFGISAPDRLPINLDYRDELPVEVVANTILVQSKSFRKSASSNAPEKNIAHANVSNNPNSPNEKRRLAEILLKQGLKSEALLQLVSAQKLIPNNKNLSRRITKLKYGKLAFWIKDKPFE